MNIEFKPTDKFTIEVNGQEIATIYNAILTLPYGQVKELVSKIDGIIIEAQSPIKDE